MDQLVADVQAPVGRRGVADQHGRDRGPSRVAGHLGQPLQAGRGWRVGDQDHGGRPAVGGDAGDAAAEHRAAAALADQVGDLAGLPLQDGQGVLESLHPLHSLKTVQLRAEADQQDLHEAGGGGGGQLDRHGVQQRSGRRRRARQRRQPSRLEVDQQLAGVAGADGHQRGQGGDRVAGGRLQLPHWHLAGQRPAAALVGGRKRRGRGVAGFPQQDLEGCGAELDGLHRRRRQAGAL